MVYNIVFGCKIGILLVNLAELKRTGVFHCVEHSRVKRTGVFHCVESSRVKKNWRVSLRGT